MQHRTIKKKIAENTKEKRFFQNPTKEIKKRKSVSERVYKLEFFKLRKRDFENSLA